MLLIFSTLGAPFLFKTKKTNWAVKIYRNEHKILTQRAQWFFFCEHCAFSAGFAVKTEMFKVEGGAEIFLNLLFY
jgi:hypothetical protein